jgi:protease IV
MIANQKQPSGLRRILLLAAVPLAAILAACSSLPLNTFKKIGLVEITDVILSSEAVVKQLRTYRDDESIAGVLLRVDSPGGAVAPSQEIYQEVLRFRTAGKPLVASLGNVAASGGYYVACPAQKIFANPGTITGSIGVIFSFPKYYKLLDKLGISVEVLKSGRVKDMGGPEREMTPEEKKLFEEILTDIHEQFINDVSRARAIRVDSLRPMADGRIMTGEQARRLGLVDTLGGFQDAADYLKKLAGLPQSAEVVEKKKRPSYLHTLLFGELAEKFPALQSTFVPAGSYFLYGRKF